MTYSLLALTFTLLAFMLLRAPSAGLLRWRSLRPAGKSGTNRNRRRGIALLIAAVALAGPVFGQLTTVPDISTVAGNGRAPAAISAAATDIWLRLPLAFEPAATGQAMIAHAGGKMVRIDPGGATTFSGSGDAKEGGEAPVAVTLRLAGSNPGATVIGANLQAGTTNYLLGNDPARWRQHIKRFGQARVPRVYPGIDLVYYGNGRELEHDYQLAPHADPGAIRLEFSAGAASLDATGALVLRTSANGAEVLRLRSPVAYQQKAGRRIQVAAAYVRKSNGAFGFSLGAYDANAPLVIDPVITYGSYFGGSNMDGVAGMQIDTAGNIYLLLSTQSIDMKTAGGPIGVCNGACGVNNPNVNNPNDWAQTPDFFIAKFNPKGDTLLFGTYLGGSGQDIPQTIAVGPDGAVYVWGSTSSTDFPTKNAYQSTPPSGLGYQNYAGALAKLSADGSQLLYSTYIGAGAGGSTSAAAGYLEPDQLTLAPNGIAYVSGYTGDWAGQTFASAVNAQFTGGKDFIAKFDTTLSGAGSLLYATPIGPPSAQNNWYNSVTVSGIAVDSKGNLWISGDTLNSGFPNPTSHAVQSGCGYPSQCNSSYLMELDPTGQSTLYATFFGGTTNVGGGPGIDYATGLSLDSQDNIYWGGRTEDADFPTKNPAHTVSDVGGNGWVAEFAAGGYPVLYASYAPCWPFSVGGYKSATDTMVSFTCEQSGNNLPLKNQISSGRAFGYNYDAYFGVYDTAGSGSSSILVESYLGSSNGVTSPYKTAFDTQGSVWLAGSTSATDLPVVDPFQATCDECQPSTGPTPDGFVTRIALVQISPFSISFPNTNTGSTSAAVTATISSLYGTAVTLGSGTLTDDTDFTQSDNCGGTVAPFGSCQVTFTFTPASSGVQNSTYSIAASAPSGSFLANLSVNLGGTGAGALSISPATHTFGATAVGSISSTATSTISNTTASAVYLSAGSLTDTKDFTESDNCGGLVVSGGTCTVTFAFTPQSSGPLTSTYSIHDLDNASSLLTVLLSGTGTPGDSLTISPSSLDFGNIQLHAISATQAITVKNNVSGGFSVTTTITGANASAFSQTNTCDAGLTAGGSCSIAVTCSPSTTGAQRAQVVVSFSLFPSQSVALSCTGTAPEVSLSPSTIGFGNVLAGATSPAVSATLSNTGNADQPIQSVTIVNASATGFAQTNTCVSSLAAGASCSIAVTCSPTTSGAVTATLAVNFPSPIPQQMSALSCTGIAPAASLTPGAYAFASTMAGSTAPFTSLTLSNPGTAPLTISSIAVTGTNASGFSIANNACGNSLAAGASCAFSVGFAPKAAGAQSATVTVVDSAGTQTSSLSGMGTTPLPPPDFTLTATPAAQTSYLGQSVTYQAVVGSANSDNPFTSSVTLSASGLPSGATATFAPASVTPGTAAAGSVMTVTISALHSDSRGVPANGRPARPPIAFAALLLAFGLIGSKRVRRQLSSARMLLVLALIGGLCAAIAGCGGTGFAVPQSTSTITVTGTSGTIAHSATVTLTLK